MDGTGLLFYRVMTELGGVDAVVVPLPQEGAQDYARLASYVESRLPEDDFVIVAESFSGGIAARLSQQEMPGLKGVVFVASFLSAPRPFLAQIARWLPIKLLSALPFTSVVHKKLFLGGDADSDLVAEFRRVVRSVPSAVLSDRLSVIANARYDGFRSPCPAVYVGAEKDALVEKSMRREFSDAYQNIAFIEVDGPHFILQARPEESAAVIHQAVSYLEGGYKVG
jgi:pimeloyl-ACP methyl ester carboxylesterase